MSDADFKNKYIGLSEKPLDLAKSCLAEMIGNIFLNFFGCMSLVDRLNDRFEMEIMRTALVFGVVIVVLIQTLSHVSGAHFNPAVTLGMLSVGRVTIIRSVFYIMSQCLGAIVGSGLLKVVTPLKFQANYGITTINPNITTFQGLLVEFLITFVLVLVVFGVTDPNKPIANVSAGFTVGMTVLIGVGTAVPYTGASINPARSVGSAVFAFGWENHWVYWLGPCLGGIIAALLYTHLFSAPSIED